ncbi:MAG TPA: choice-of-anchor D domain-containing protein [Candidatus Angelobacter sp.]|nr:choice-of-anchor D domain-containing protein [Candidatus Angelobacter sp.]
MTYRRSLASFAALLFAIAFAWAQATAQSNVADLAISALATTPDLPGASFTYHVFVSNLGPNGSQGPAVITGTLPAGVTPTHCVAGWGGPFENIPGTCVIVGQSVTGTVPQSLGLATSAQQYFLDLDATLTPSVPNGGAVYSATFSVSGPSTDPNPANNSTTTIITTPAPLSITVSPQQLSFGVVALNHNSSSLTLSVANTGKSAFFYHTPVLTGDFVAINDSCTGFPRPGVTTEVLVTPGLTCAATVAFVPASLGPASGTITFSETDWVGQSAQQVLQLSGVGSTIALQPSNFTFPQPQADGTSSSVRITLINVASTPIPIGEIQTSSNFSQTNDCASVAQPQSMCNISVSFTPTVVGAVSGTLTVPAQAPGSPLVATLQGTGSAVKLTPSPNQSPTFDFGTQDLGTPSDPFQVMLTNVSTQPMTLNSISATGSGFHEKDDCLRRLNAGESCTISATFDPKFDGPEVGSLVIDPKDPIGPQAFALSGTGLGILHNVVLLHYDYLVADNHTHDPEVVAPGAIHEVVKAFARHGITLIIDPHHTAIPESALPPGDFPTVVLGTGNCGGAPGFVNFYDLKAAYYHAKRQKTHYVIFSHYIATSEGGESCSPGAFSGFAELPGQNFVVAMAQLTFAGAPASFQKFIVASDVMHELGHNLGLHHGGGFGVFGDDTNFKPNYLSVMNYIYIFGGILQADAVSSSHLRSCSRDSDCGGDGGLCVDMGLPGSPSNACFRLDYSRQLLPTGGNTPGALNEADLNEVAGLGSGTPDLFYFTDGRCNSQVAPSTGPVDWDGDGSPTNEHAAAHVSTDGACPSNFFTTLPGFNDWEALNGNLDATETENEANSAAPRPVAVEMDLDTIRQKHLLYPPRPAEIVARPGCDLPSAPVAPGQPGTLTITIPGTGSLDVREVDLSSLTLHGLNPLSATIVDATGDGRPDLVLTFDTAQLHLSSQQKEVHLSGWLKNSQRFVANASVTIVNDMSTQPDACRR